MKSYHCISLQSLCATLLASLALLAVLMSPSPAGAQTNGLISGTVTDKSGAAVVGAQVVIANVGGNLTRNTETNGDGVYVASSLSPGTYNITVSAKGFQKFEAKGVVLEVAQKERVDVTLTVGTISEEVIVSGENVAQVDTQSAEMSSTITSKQVQELELNGRNFTQLVTLAPGVVSQTGQDEGTVGVAGNTVYSVNGGRGEYNNWEIDGGDNMDNGSNNSLNVYPNLEAISEFKVLTSNYGAQYGRNGSGTVEVEIKPGTAQFHGSAFYYGRNDFFNANSWFDNGNSIARPAYKKHDWGYTIGGPVYIPGLYNNDKKKTFFFWSQEWRREKVGNANPVSQAVPSADERKGIFNDVCPAYSPGSTFDPTIYQACPYQSVDSTGTIATPFPQNTLPTPFPTTAQALLTLIPAANNFNGVAGVYPTPGGTAAGTNIPAYVANPSLPTHWREELLRVDHNLTENQRLMFHWIHDTWGTVNQGPLWGQYNNTFDNTNTTFVGPTTSFVARLTSNFSPSLLNEFVASYTDDHIFLSNVSNNIKLPSGGIDLAPLFANGLGGKIPAFSVGNTGDGLVYGSGGFNVDTGYFPWKNANPTYTYRDTVTKIIANHTLFFGAYFVAAQKNQSASFDKQGQLSFANGVTGFSGNPFADLLLGNVQQYTQNATQLYYYDRYKILEPFFQDDWRVTHKLTLNLGLRWSIFGRYQEKNAREFGFSAAAYNPDAAPPFFPFGSVTPAFPNGSPNSQLLNIGSGQSLYNGLVQCGQSSPTIPGVSPGVQGCLRNKWNNPGPRLGFAYDPFGDGKWAIRGGYGIFFEHMNGNEANAELLQQSPSPLAPNGTVNNITGYANVAQPLGPPSPLTPFSIPDKILWPYVQQWNLGVEHELPGNVLLSVAYVGSKGTHLTREYDLNQLTPVPASQNPYILNNLGAMTTADCNSIQVDNNPTNNPNDPTWGLPISASIMGTQGTAPVTVTDQHVLQNLFVACKNSAQNYFRKYQGWGSIVRVEPSANSIYNSLQISARRSIGGLTFSASYTYSHSIDNSSDRSDSLFVDPANPGVSRASSNFDIRHAFSLSYVYALPFFKAPGLTHTLLGGWQVSGITTALSGAPFTVTNGGGDASYTDPAGLANGVSSAVLSFPLVVGNPNNISQAERSAYTGPNGVFGVLAFSPDAYALPVGLTYGNAGRNTLRLPGRLNFDFGLFKSFPIKERYAFEFRWENFNVFNHTQLDGVNGLTSSSGTGLNDTLGCYSCVSSSYVLNQAHNPRIMQFGLRFQF